MSLIFIRVFCIFQVIDFGLDSTQLDIKKQCSFNYRFFFTVLQIKIIVNSIMLNNY